MWSIDQLVRRRVLHIWARLKGRTLNRKVVGLASLGAGAILLSNVWATGVVSASAERCITDWAEAGAVVKARKIQDVSDMSALVRDKFGGKLTKARLCQSGETYFYRLVIRRNDGRMERLRIDARKAGK
jgi:uncharacterized membrane protein YkoI